MKQIFRTPGPRAHFFGYYDKSPLDAAGQHLLTHEVSEDLERFTADSKADVVVFDITDGSKRALSQTKALNWQQGSMLQWIPPDHSSTVVFNDVDVDGRAIARIVDLEGRVLRVLDRAIYSIHPTKRVAVGVPFERLASTHPGYSYEGLDTERYEGDVSSRDGIYMIDLDTGSARTLVRTSELLEVSPVNSMFGARHYVEHLMFSPDGSSIIFLHRWHLADGGIYSRILNCDASGNVRLVFDSGWFSHYGWRSPEEFVGWGRKPGGITRLRRHNAVTKAVLKPLRGAYRRLASRGGALRAAVTGDTYLRILLDGRFRELSARQRFPGDGHCTWNPVYTRWMLTDTYQDADDKRTLLLYDSVGDKIVTLDRFDSSPTLDGTASRCDLHPRWSRNGRLVCIDSVHEGSRQHYVFDVSSVLETN